MIITAVNGVLASFAALPTAISYRDLVVSDTPYSYYRLGETVGASTAVDEMGSHNMTLTGTTTLGVPGAIIADADTAIDFALHAQGRAVAAPTIGTGDFAIEFWINSAFSSDLRYLFRLENAADDTELIYLRQSGDSLEFIAGSTGIFPPYDGVLLDSTWHHIVATRESGTVKLYVDGVMTNSRANTDSLAAAGFLYIAKGIFGLDYAGKFDEVAFYTHALTAAQVLTHYQKAT